MPQLVIFDIDQTLVESKQPLTEKMAELLAALSHKAKIAAISGGTLEIFERNILTHLPALMPLENLSLLPTSGAALYEYAEGKWNAVYEERLTTEEMQKIRDALMSAAESIIDFTAHSYGERIELRGSQVTLSALGQEAPLGEKATWDPEQAKRKEIVAKLAPMLPGYDLKIGGMTSIDVTKHGINKAYGVRKLSEHLNIPISQMLYVGDALFPGGNDEVVKESGIRTRAVKDPAETENIIEELLR